MKQIKINYGNMQLKLKYKIHINLIFSYCLLMLKAIDWCFWHVHYVHRCPQTNLDGFTSITCMHWVVFTFTPICLCTLTYIKQVKTCFLNHHLNIYWKFLFVWQSSFYSMTYISELMYKLFDTCSMILNLQNFTILAENLLSTTIQMLNTL